MVTSRNNLYIEDCIFTNNHVSLNGGAITFDENANAVVLGGYCSKNHAKGRGGCISIQGISKPNITMNMENNIAFIAGGGIYASSNSDINIFNSSITCNTASIGGGIFIENTVTGSISYSNFINNSASVGGGAFIQGSSINIYYSAFLDNSAQQNGGGMAIEGTSLRLELNQTIVQSNSAVNYGGGIFLSDNSMLIDSEYELPSTIYDFNVNRIVIAQNRADYGGGIFVTTKNPPTFGGDVLLKQNIAKFMGGAVFISGTQTTTVSINFYFVKSKM